MRLAVVAGLVLSTATAGARPGSVRDIVRVADLDRRGVVLELGDVRPELELDDVNARGVRVKGFGQIREPGWPALPRISKLIELPDSSTPSLRVRVAEVSRTTIGLRPWFPADDSFPMRRLGEGPGRAPVWPEQSARIAWTGRLRGSDVALVEMFPVRWERATGTLLVARGMNLTVEFDAAGDGSTESSQSSRATTSTPSPPPSGTAPEQSYARGSFVDRVNIVQRDSSGGGVLLMDPVRIRIREPGIYRVTGEELAAAGLSMAGIDPRRFQLLNRGSFVDIRVEGEQDGEFEPEDAIVFYAERFESRYTDSNVYWLQLGNRLGPRMRLRDASPGVGTSPSALRAELRYEESHIYTSPSVPAQPDEHWWWERLDYPSNSSYPSKSSAYRFMLPALPAVATNARLRFNVQGRSNMPGSPDHRSRLFVNDVMVDDLSWEGLASTTHDVTLDPASLHEGENVVTIRLAAVAGVSYASAYTNWMHLEYDQAPVAGNDLLRFHAPADPGPIAIDDFSSPEIEIYDVRDPLRPVRLTSIAITLEGTRWSARFDHDGADDVSYVALTRAARSSPFEILSDPPTSWRSPDNGADWIVVTPELFEQQLAPLVELREAEGLRTATVRVTDIMDEFADGLYTPVAIRDFLAYAYRNWESPAPLHVLLFGDANLDYRNYLGYGQDYVPTMLTGSLPGIGEVMTDLYFARIDGDDPLPDLNIGRIPVRSAAEAELVIDRVVASSTVPPPTGITLVADDGLSIYDPIFESIAEDLASVVPETLETRRVYAADLSSNSAIRTEIRNSVTNGSGAIVYIGHGNIDIWGSKLGQSGSFWRLSDVGALSEDSTPTFAIALNCINGYFADFSRTSLAEAWFGAGGALAAWAPSGLTDVSDAAILGRQLLENMFGEPIVSLGEAITETLVNSHAGSGVSADALQQMLLFGDPAIRLALPAAGKKGSDLSCDELRRPVHARRLAVK